MATLEELLLTVQKPGRYIGGEWNSVKKEWSADRVKVCLAFPDTYEVGMSHLGLKILYGILNKRDDCLAERVFTPWADFDAVLRANGMPLYSLESRRPLRDFDIVGFSLAFELCYTNVLTMLDLGGIPLESSARTDADPLVIAGGPAVFNPEPMAEFIDAFVIGEAEEAVGEIVDAYKRSGCGVRPAAARLAAAPPAGSGEKEKRKKLLRVLAQIPGIYVPSLYEVTYNDDGTLRAFTPLPGSGAPEKVKKRIVEDLDAAFYPVDQIVPYLAIVHDRIAIEIMRGCPHACRFCQAGATYRPCRERSIETIERIAEEAYRATGYEEISFLSLSSGDHSRIGEIIGRLNAHFKGKGVSLSVPSLRVQDMLNKLPALLSEAKKGGLTFAPEAGTERLRGMIGKNIDIEALYDAVTASYRSGWRRVKLYFMIGFPGETDEDVAAIVDVATKISELKRSVDKRPAQVTASVNALIPKPHTPLQWDPMETCVELERKKSLLKARARSRSVEFDLRPFETGYLEAVLARGDRRLSGVILAAWRSGARFDGWSERFDLGRWRGAFSSRGLDPGFYAVRRRAEDELLPWDFIDTGTSKASLAALSRPHVAT